MHKSLTRKTNRTLIAIYSAGVAVLMIVTGDVIFLACLVGAAFGIIAGVLQRRVLQTHAAEFIQTTTAMDVRRVMTSSRAGTAAISLTWISGATLLILALVFGKLTLAWLSWFAGFLAFMLFRDLIAYSTLPAVAEAPPSKRARIP